MAKATVVDPEGNEWTVRRRWVHRRLRWRGRGSLDAFDASELIGHGADLPVIGILFLVVAVILLAVAAVLFVIPAVIFLVELSFVLAVVLVGVLGRVLFGRPWTVEAHRQDALHRYEWKVTGWRASSELVRSVAEQARTTGMPTGGTPVPIAPA